MTIQVIYPAHAHGAYKIAAEAFSGLSEKVSGAFVTMISDAELSASAADLTVLIGNDAANHCVSELYLSCKTDSFGIRYGTDDYCIRCEDIDGKRILMLVGGRPRATIYAVYRYFELFCGCRWFWDGDRIPCGELFVGDINITESPRFDYRGLRYFAHRSLHRFQAEQWDISDWETEIDWMLKKRLNLFMLRIGTDDVFQKAFPEIVDYPSRDEKLPEAGPGYDDRTLFWSLEHRGELRKKILRYAFERDLWHPEDCGTMTHWYSRTPRAFLDKVKPSLLPQSSRHYADPTGLAWDIRDDKNFDNYFDLTRTHVREYGKPEIFHTIGLGERRYSEDRELNRRMKLYVYRKIALRVQEEYPNSPLFIASWDLWQKFTPDEVRELVAELNPSQAVILDYTSDTKNENCYKVWGVEKKFPWIFGIFSGFEPNSEIRGLYDFTNARLAEAKKDPMCRGLILWPELSHGDPFIIEYLANNAWDNETPPIPDQIKKYCRDRYSPALAPKMEEIWLKFIPIIQLDAWSMGGEYRPYGDDIFFDLKKKAEFDKNNAEHYERKFARYEKHKDAAREILLSLSEIEIDDEMARRDIFDIARTVVSRYINASIYRAEQIYTQGGTAEELEPVMNIGEGLLEAMVGILSLHSDYSLCDSLSRLQKAAKTNPNFEQTLKNNAECSYCRSYIYENAKYLYLPEMKAMFETVKKCVLSGDEYRVQMIEDRFAEIRKIYFDTPLSAMKAECGTLREKLCNAAAQIKGI